jgi:hypothetical protein
MTTKRGVVHAIFRCDDCAAEWSHYLSAQRLAAQHAREFKHMVQGEIGTSCVYDGKG